MHKIPDKFQMIKHPETALRIFRKLRWNGKVTCPMCGCIEDIRTHSKSKNGIRRYFCDNCSKTFSDTTGTVFNKSKISIWKWMYVLMILLESTASLSAAEVSRNISVTYKTALRMMRKIRSSLLDDRYSGTLRGIIESDEAWISHKDNQTVLLGMVQRDGGVKFFPIIDRSVDSIYFPHRLYVEKGSIVCSDGHSAYNSLFPRFTHHWVNHSVGEFA